MYGRPPTCIPVAIEEFAQGAGFGMQKFLDAQVGDLAGDVAPFVVSAGLDPRQARLEHVHVRIGLGRQGARIGFLEAAHRVGIVGDDLVTDGDARRFQRLVIRADAVSRGIGQHGEGMVVEVKLAAHDRAVRLQCGIEHTGFRIARRTRQPFQALVNRRIRLALITHAPGERIGKDLAGGHAGAAIDIVRPAVEIDLLKEATLFVITADIPPQGQGVIEQPLAQGLLFFDKGLGECRHRSGSHKDDGSWITGLDQKRVKIQSGLAWICN